MNANRKRNLRQALRRKELYLKNIIDELHKQTIKYLSERYSRIIISPFESQKLDKILSRRQTRILKCLSHYKFKKRLIDKAKEKNIKIEIREEYYTSITCTKCGNINYDLGNKDVYECVNDKCKIKSGRDYNGARNILLRNININY
jgi:transposase